MAASVGSVRSDWSEAGLMMPTRCHIHLNSFGLDGPWVLLEEIKRSTAEVYVKIFTYFYVLSWFLKKESFIVLYFCCIYLWIERRL